MLKKPNRIILLVSLLLVCGFLATSLASYFVSRTSLREEIEKNTLPLTSDNIYSEIQRDLLRPIFISSLMAHDTFLRDWVIAGEQDPSRITRYLKEIKTKYGTFTSFFVSEKTWNYYYADGVLKTVSPDEERDRWYFRVRTMAPEYEINVDPDMANRDAMTIFINYKVYDFAGNYIGATGVGLTVNAVKELIETYQRRYRRDIFFVDRAGTVTLSSQGFSGRGHRLQEMPGIDALAAQILAADSLTVKYRRGGETIHLNTRFIEEFGWYLLVEQAEDETLQPIHNALIVNLWLCALVTLIVLSVTRAALAAYQRRLEESAATDKLTGAYNRRSFEEFFTLAVADARRTEGALAVLLFDLDHFKRVNDSLGHQAGDKVLQAVAERVRGATRETDLFFRWGGEEFLVLLKGCPLENALAIAEKLRAAISTPPLQYDGRAIDITASFGVAAFLPGEEFDDLMKRVDQALYLAKARGRNCSVASPATERL